MNDYENLRERLSTFPVSDLTERLLRRAREPVGVIDVRQVERLHTRTPPWHIQRLEFLDNFRAIYGLDQGASFGPPVPCSTAKGMPFVEAFTTKASSEIPSFSPSRPSVMRKTMPKPTTDAVSEAAPTWQLRVKRPQVILEASIGQLGAPSAGSMPPSPSELSEIRAQSVGDSLGLRLGREPKEAAVPTYGRSEPYDFATSAADDRDSFRGSADLPGSGAPRQGADPLSAVGTAAILRSEPFISALDIPTRNLAPGDQPSAPEMKSFPQAKEITRRNVSSPDEMHLQRKYDAAEGSGESTVIDTRENGTTVSGFSLQTYVTRASANGGSHSAAVSKEIPAIPTVANGTTIVWRKPNANGPEASYRNVSTGTQFLAVPRHGDSVHLMRQVASDSNVSAPASSPSNAMPKMAHSSGNGATDIMQIAERVSRVIARQLAIERERRGKTR